MNPKKNRTGIVYSTNPDFVYQGGEHTSPETPLPQLQKLQVQLDKKQRAGKQVTLVTGFIGTDTDLQTLCKLLKTKCGVGGSAKDAKILIQGDFCTKITEILSKEGYKVKTK